MKTLVIVPLLLVIAASGGRAFAQDSAETGQIGGAVSTAVDQSAPPASTTLSVRGTIDKYDASTWTLSLSASNGTLQFSVTSTTRIRQGWRKVDAVELSKYAGDRATVRYMESGGNKIAESVHVFGKNERRER